MTDYRRNRRSDALADRVDEVLHSLRPLAQRDGGDIEFLEVDDDGVVRVRLHGACVGCPSSHLTLTLGIERNLKNMIPEVTRVECG
jgi:Fe-S cluster biogenesis protein NfuA